MIRGGHIAEIVSGKRLGKNVRVIDGRGRYAIPGLIDAHVHVGNSAALDEDAVDAHPDLWAAYKAQLPKSYLAFGFTTLVDLDDTAAALKDFAAWPVRPRFYHCGQGIKVAGGYGAQRLPPLDSPRFPNLVYEPDAAKSWPKNLKPADFTPARAVERVVQTGAICVKVFVEPGFGGAFHWPVPSAATLQTLRENARARGLKFIVHANSVKAWNAALDAGADIIAHGLWHWPGEFTDSSVAPAARDVILRAAAERQHVQPTMQVIYGEKAVVDWAILNDPRMDFALPKSVLAYLRSPEGQKSLKVLSDNYSENAPPPGFAALMVKFAERVKGAVELMHTSGVPLLFGSDTPSGEGVGNPPGLNGRLELQDWADAEIPLNEILRAATLGNAVAFGLDEDLGSIEPGKRADILLLRANPLASISAYDSIETVVLNGEPIARASLAPKD